MSQTLAVSAYRPKEDSIASVVVVHGMAEHRKRYDEFAHYLQKEGFVVFTYDLPGHGETSKDKEKGYFGPKNGWDNLVKSVEEVVKECKKQYPNIPCILFGHSMGTMLSRCYIQQWDDEIDGLILSGAPCYNASAKQGMRLARMIRNFKGAKGHSRLLDGIIIGNFNKSVSNPKTPFDWLSYNEENVQHYIEDELCGFPFTIQGYLDELSGMMQMNDETRFEVKQKELPIFFFAGEEDPCIGGKDGWDSSINLLKKVGYHSISTRLYPGMRHETLNETDRVRVYDEVVSWLKDHFA